MVRIWRIGYLLPTPVLSCRRQTDEVTFQDHTTSQLFILKVHKGPHKIMHSQPFAEVNSAVIFNFWLSISGRLCKEILLIALGSWIRGFELRFVTVVESRMYHKPSKSDCLAPKQLHAHYGPQADASMPPWPCLVSSLTTYCTYSLLSWWNSGLRLFYSYIIGH